MTNFITRMQEVRSQIAALESAESELVASIIKEAGHNKTGQGTYDMDGYKVTIKTGENVTLDKSLLNTIWKETMPINRTYSYTLRQRDFDALMANGTAAQRSLLSKIVCTKPAKPSIKIEEK